MTSIPAEEKRGRGRKLPLWSTVWCGHVRRNETKKALPRVERAQTASGVPGSVQAGGRLFGQAPESLVEPDPAVDAAQGAQGAKPAEAVAPAV